MMPSIKCVPDFNYWGGVCSLNCPLTCPCNWPGSGSKSLSLKLVFTCLLQWSCCLNCAEVVHRRPGVKIYLKVSFKRCFCLATWQQQKWRMAKGLFPWGHLWFFSYRNNYLARLVKLMIDLHSVIGAFWGLIL